MSSSENFSPPVAFVRPWILWALALIIFIGGQEAISTVDETRNASDWRRGYAFKTFIAAFRASLTGDPRNPKYDYNPTVYPTVAAEIRQKLLSTALRQANVPDSQDDNPTATHEGSSALGSSHDVPQSSQDAFSNLADSNALVDNILVHSTPTHEGPFPLGSSSPHADTSGHTLESGVTWGRALLRAMEWSTESIDILEAFISQARLDPAQFSVDIVKEFPDTMTPKLASFVWALYYRKLNEPYASEL
ncbi:hypothetical protein F5878DRAFT_668186 [Lentinula raphanica]|uniref:Uncharacterized protein n=1 Tax=Lentinula raphanica TaxID=153919 RepID=A0AA38NUQ0_9AGAR|nr:hypothetical protein F5878DRAFT_668186 [Lentinula raphanica]